MGVSKEMEQETQGILESARTGLELANKSGLLNKVVSLITFRQSEKPVHPVDYHEVALKALQENAVETFRGLELTVDEAVRILQPSFSLDDLDKVNSTWQRHWTEGAARVGLEEQERRTWWARLLAGEIQQPETYSLRTLAVMDTLSTKEARLFTRLCDYVWNIGHPVLILPPHESDLWKPDFLEATTVESIGLAKFNSLTGFHVSAEEHSEDNVQQLPPSLTVAFNDDLYFIQDSYVKLRCGTLLLTDVGKEMFSLTTPNHPQSYRDEIVSEWRKSYTVQHVRRTVARNS